MTFLLMISTCFWGINRSILRCHSFGGMSFSPLSFSSKKNRDISASVQFTINDQIRFLRMITVAAPAAASSASIIPPCDAAAVFVVSVVSVPAVVLSVLTSTRLSTEACNVSTMSLTSSCVTSAFASIALARATFWITGCALTLVYALSSRLFT